MYDCVADIVGNANVKASSPMNGGIVIFVSCEEAVNAVVSHGIVISHVMHIVEPLVTPLLKLILSNVPPPPYIRNDRLIPFIEQHGRIISDIRYLKASLKREKLQHVVSFRRQVSILPFEAGVDINQPVTLDFDGMVHTIYMSSGKIICFQCQCRGHIAAQCPKVPIGTHVKKIQTQLKRVAMPGNQKMWFLLYLMRHHPSHKPGG